jgi:hypothetical protein
MTTTRRRPYLIKTITAASNITTDRQTILTPRKGYRTRLVRVKVHQDIADGRHLWELYFGTAGNIITDQKKGIDILAVKNLGSASSRTYLRNEGPRGLRDEVLSGRWRGTAPTDAHRIIIEYQEEP